MIENDRAAFLTACMHAIEHVDLYFDDFFARLATAPRDPLKAPYGVACAGLGYVARSETYPASIRIIRVSGYYPDN